MESSNEGAGDWFAASDAPVEGARVQMRRRADGGMDVRSSAAPNTVLHYTVAEWDAWLDGASQQEFDHLIPEE